MYNECSYSRSVNVMIFIIRVIFLSHIWFMRPCNLCSRMHRKNGQFVASKDFSKIDAGNLDSSDGTPSAESVWVRDWPLTYYIASYQDYFFYIVSLFWYCHSKSWHFIFWTITKTKSMPTLWNQWKVYSSNAAGPGRSKISLQCLRTHVGKQGKCYYS